MWDLGELRSDDGPHLLEAGDGVGLTGVDHGWVVGPEGVTFVTLIVGSPPRPEE